MKMVCIGRNYSDHAKELGNDAPGEPLFFIKPSTALLPVGRPFKLPSFSNDIHHELELVLRIGQQAKEVGTSNAMDHVDGLTIGLDLTARDVQTDLKRQGHPWEKAKAFDGSAVLADRFLAPASVDLQHVHFALEKNGNTVQQGCSADMLFTFPTLLAHVSRYVTLEVGDLLFTGTPAGVGPLHVGDRLVGRLNGEVLLKLDVE